MNLKKLSFIFLDIAMVVLSVSTASYLKFEFSLPSKNYDMLMGFIPLASILTVLFTLIVGGYRSNLDFFGFTELFKQILVSVFVGTTFLLLKFMGKMELPGSIIVMHCFIFFILSSCIRGGGRFQRWLISKHKVKNPNMKRVLIIGAGNAGSLVAKQLINSQNSEMYPIGFVDDDQNKQKTVVVGVKVLGGIEQTPYFSKMMEVDELLIAMPSATEQELNEIFDAISPANLPTKIFQNAIDVEKYRQGSQQALKKITIEDLLFRESIQTDNALTRSFIEGNIVMVTGGAGSIGSELCRQILENGCKHLVIFDFNENGLFQINEDLKEKYLYRYTTVQGSVRDAHRLKIVFDHYKPKLVFHAAAHKHVPMMEINPFEAVKNNVFGTLNVMEQAIDHNCAKFLLISTDKAVNPTNVMGATKRACELLVRAYGDRNTEMVAVRFGNVLGSNGSVVPLFQRQIEEGGPLTVTDKGVTRYFMTIKEAVSLVLSAGASAEKSEFFVLDMGQPVKIYDMAVNMIRLSGKVPFQDIDIKVTGLRPGEKLFEELRLDKETIDATTHEKIFIMREQDVDKEYICHTLNHLSDLVKEELDEEGLRKALFDLIQEENYSLGGK